ncbi:MAG: hypothetical protein COU35_00460 [Candidatus Magasanikbacteria bacterium CG10_big_fil_rev_8_21_14_0_10_47_10]|uniref:Zinc-finger domain-containing protein n=1 Tax=Candidatus Magasanikbacteria bacterium CG10_big_fil_rev_8_21_14_0_10_47_10 TaxID=1974652 RepID=A0A2H0TRQ7_9BACT|nr:MAG: hypothetical protein COU35_00460 [Candidatus Magasanikbacteria bacterium CG10_big_fil_rev_8_21_14_0_10_47_10]
MDAGSGISSDRCLQLMNKTRLVGKDFEELFDHVAQCPGCLDVLRGVNQPYYEIARPMTEEDDVRIAEDLLERQRQARGQQTPTYDDNVRWRVIVVIIIVAATVIIVITRL